MPNSSLYAMYLTERTDDKIIEISEGFATYRYYPKTKSVYIIDIFVKPEFRNSNVASKMADSIIEEAKKEGFIQAIGTVAPSAKGSTASMRVLLAYGMVLDSASQDVVVFRKDI